MSRGRPIKKHSVIGWKLDENERGHLLDQFAPVFADVVADHVTLQLGKGELPKERRGEIVGQVDDGEGVQTLVVAIGGTTRRPDGSAFHITWSLDRAKGRRAVESNHVLAKLGWRALASPVPITLLPARF